MFVLFCKFFGRFWPPGGSTSLIAALSLHGGATCIKCKLDHRMAPLSLVIIFMNKLYISKVYTTYCDGHVNPKSEKKLIFSPKYEQRRFQTNTSFQTLFLLLPAYLQVQPTIRQIRLTHLDPTLLHLPTTNIHCW